MHNDLVLLNRLLEIYEQRYIAEYLNEIGDDCWNREKINRWLNGKTTTKFSFSEYEALQKLLPKQKVNSNDFSFIDLFAGIGGIRKGFESVGGQCVFTSEWDKFAIKTYKANYSNCSEHVFNEDIKDITLTNKENIAENESFERIDNMIPDHDLLLAGFPCQPFSLAGVSKKNALGRSHGFACQTQGTLFFDIARILEVKKPVAFMLENVKNIKGHDKGNTFKIIIKTLEELGYFVADIDITGSADPKIIDGQNFLPQHRERIILAGFRKDLNVHEGFTLKDVKQYFPEVKPTLLDILEKKVNPKYILTERLWEYLYNYAKKHQAKGNGFGYGLVDPDNKSVVTRTLSARYHKDGSEILINRGWNFELGERDFWNKKNQANRPRRLTPRECARLMGFDKPKKSSFLIPVSDTQAYRQFGNSVCVPVFESVAKLMKPYILRAKDKDKKMIAEKESVLV
ncbi:MAG: DNA (cytosine-5-)-methyltransferase [Denitrovibrio sp.]|nr:MAG: DNA (cytosine-5-)-methyltransferase [Denitrovibrio sp.]